MQRISVNLTNDCDGNQLNYNNNLAAIGNNNYVLQKPFGTDFLTVIGNAKLIFFYVKLFARIILSWNSLNCIFWYLLELSDPFIKNENSILPILVEKNFQQKITFVSWKWGPFFVKNGNLIFSTKLGQRLPKSCSQLHVKNSRFFHSYFLKKDDWPEAYAGPRLATLLRL